MKGNKGLKILKLFDYFKEAFAVNINNKGLYKPQLAYLVLRGILLFLSGLAITDLAATMAPFIGNVDFTKFFQLLWSEFKGTPMILMAVTTIVMLFGSTYVEAGLYGMYNKATDGEDIDGVFAPSANRYFFSFLLGNILIFIFWLIILIPYLIVGLLTLTIGLIWIPLFFSALMMVWKAALVSEDIGLIDAIKESIAFGKRHFIPATFFVILREALSRMGGSGGGGGNGTSNISNTFNNNNLGSDFGGSGFGGGPDMGSSFLDSGFDFGIIRIIAVSGITLVSIMTIIVGAIHMIFDIFFGLTSVIIYKDDWHVEVPEETTSGDADKTNNDSDDVEVIQ